MNTDNNVQKYHYFEYRSIDAEASIDSNTPIWIKNEITNHEMNILDYGCGFGQMIKSLIDEQYSNVYGVDIQEQAIKYCLNNNYNVKELNLKNLENPFNIKFDIIILSHIVEHIPKSEIINTLSLIKNKFLVKGGKLLISVPNAQSNTGCYWAYEDWTHTTLFTSGSLYYVLKAAGYSNVEYLDIDCTLGSIGIKKLIRIALLKLYKMNKYISNKITCSAYHSPSPQIFSYEIKCKAY